MFYYLNKGVMQGKIYDIDGLYSTFTQMRFFLNRPNGEQMFLSQHEDFNKYLKVCKAYNLVDDLLNDYPDDGFFYWDEEKGCVSFAFEEEGAISKILDYFNVSSMDFGNGKNL